MKKVLTFGTFDVIHPGHEYFLQQAKKYGDTLTVVVARDVTVREIKRQEPIFHENIRVRELERLGVADQVILGRTGDKLAVVREISPHVVCLGYDQKTFVDLLESMLREEDYSFSIQRLAAHKPNRYKSSHYRDRFIQGVVVPGKGVGKTLGYPTANIDYTAASLKPAPGVYAATVWSDNHVHPAIAVIGMREENSKSLFEVHLLNHSEDIYGQRLTVTLEYKIRDIEKYKNDADLIIQIEKDIEYVHRNNPKRWENI